MFHRLSSGIGTKTHVEYFFFSLYVQFVDCGGRICLCVDFFVNVETKKLACILHDLDIDSRPESEESLPSTNFSSSELQNLRFLSYP